MVQPVLAADGHNYEREAIERWLGTSPTSPITKQPLQPGQLLPNETLRREIAQWHAEQHGSIAAHLLTLGAEIGRGATGVVYAGTLLRDGSAPLPVAVKMLHPGGASAEVMAVLEREMAALQRIVRDCPHVVQLLGTAVQNSQLCIVAKRYAGNLGSLLRSNPDGRMALVPAMVTARSLFVAIAGLHKRNVTTRSITPQ